MMSLEACQRSSSPHGSSPTSAVASPGGTGATVQTQTVKKDPCGWIAAIDAQHALGHELLAAPRRVVSAEIRTPALDGETCQYRLEGLDANQDSIALQIMADEPGLLQTSFVRMNQLDEKLQVTEAAQDRFTKGPWDFMSPVPGGLTAVGSGRIVMQLVPSPELVSQALALARSILERIPDLPFVLETSDPAVLPQGPDPCSLIDRTAGEAALGKPIIATFRSRKATARAYGSGGSCTYFLCAHRALVLTPKYSHAKTLFDLTDVGEEIAATTQPDAVSSPPAQAGWDRIIEGPKGDLQALKGDRRVGVQYKGANASSETAMRFLNLTYDRP